MRSNDQIHKLQLWVSDGIAPIFFEDRDDRTLAHQIKRTFNSLTVDLRSLSNLSCRLVSP